MIGHDDEECEGCDGEDGERDVDPMRLRTITEQPKLQLSFLGSVIQGIIHLPLFQCFCG